MALISRSIIEGGVFRMPQAAPGSRLVLDPGGGQEVLIATADANGIAVSGLAKGKYWLAFATSEDGELVRFGELEVLPLADEYEVQLRAELEDLNQRIQDGEGHLITKSDGDAGATETRISLASLRRQRRQAEARLASYLRRKSGRSEATRWA